MTYSIVLAGLQALLAAHRDKLVVVEATLGARPHEDVGGLAFGASLQRHLARHAARQGFAAFVRLQ
jgi:hypothetical protein